MTEVKSFEDTLKEDDNIEYAFAIIRDKKGNVGLKALTERLTQTQIYDACHAIARNIHAQEVADAVGSAMLQAVQTTQKQKGGLIVPSDLKI